MATPSITQVTYGRTVNLGDYENARIELSARVEPGQTYEQVLNGLRDLMDQQEEQERQDCATRRAERRERSRR